MVKGSQNWVSPIVEGADANSTAYAVTAEAMSANTARSFQSFCFLCGCQQKSSLNLC